MQIKLEPKSYASLEIDALVTRVFEGDDPIQGRVAELDQLTGGLLKKLATSGELTGKTLEFTLIHAPAGLKAARLLLVGAGKKDQFNVATLRKIAGAALRSLKAKSVKNFAFLAGGTLPPEDGSQAIVEGLLTGNFETDKYKTDKKEKKIEFVSLVGFPEAETAAIQKGMARGRIIAESQNFTRDLVNEPSNKLTPRVLAEKAEAMAKEAGLAVEIFDEKKIADLKMGALLSVAQGSDEPPRFIAVTHTPPNPKPGAPVHDGKQLGATHLVDAATLTGAIVVALANVNVGVFGSDQTWTDKLLASAKATGEKMWQLPMDDEYRELIKGSFADIQNISSGKGGGSITGAWFIREFAGDTPWIHLDIAGTAWNDDAKPWLAKGPTGVALRTLVHLVSTF